MCTSLRPQVMTWAVLENQARGAENRAARCPRWQVFARPALLAEARRRRTKADRRWGQMPADPLDLLARDLLIAAWEQEAGRVSTRNPFHPSLDGVRREYLPGILARLCAEPLREFLPGPRRQKAIADIPGLPERLAFDYADAALQAEADRLRGVVADGTFLVDQEDHVLTIQLKASGLRGTFSMAANMPGFGIVYSKPYRIASLDPENPGVSTDWQQYIGLGIGARIYREAARLLPEIRWMSHTTSDHASGLRRRLHTEDPAAWEAPCSWCHNHGIDWRDATRGDFDRHS